MPGSSDTEGIPGYVVTAKGPFSDSFNYPALLTTYTPGTECSTEWVYDTSTPGSVYKGLGDVSSTYAKTCLPYRGTNNHFRPGLCPSGQKFKRMDMTVESMSDGMVTASRWYAAICCSSEYQLTYRDESHIECRTGLLPLITASVNGATGTTFTETGTYINTPAVGVEQPIFIFWNETDLTLFPDPIANSLRSIMYLPPIIHSTSVPSTLSTLTTGTDGNSPQAQNPSPLPTTAAALQPSSTSPYGDPNPPENPSPFSTGATIGIAVGLVAFFGLIVAGVYVLCARHRRKKQQQLQELQSQNAEGEHGAQLKELMDAHRAAVYGQDSANTGYAVQNQGHQGQTELQGQSQFPVELEATPWDGGSGSGAAGRGHGWD
ncbi:uncharacterized protein F4822DRAFT_432590 [Hypoxylon trugodes]|uniref:uncharacterized protein n=1 Tax=Hypoxylon trugodes TaxID=326681 RepID=UPI0021981A6E|nr:uncharacterized protein F4822DRAFT_432590 [Hypoxylon trugodes]KAI1385736.1 hypothetical protein F4822DRAFT_432590 [Hypoxylon trugodes]